jgi:hypothetical protein
MTNRASNAPGLALPKVRPMPAPQGLSVRIKLGLARMSALTREAYACRACGLGGHLNRHEEPPRSHGNWKRFCERASIVEIRRRFVMLCDTCHAQRHPVPGAVVKLCIEILDVRLGTDGILKFTRVLMAGEFRASEEWLVGPRHILVLSEDDQ